MKKKVHFSHIYLVTLAMLLVLTGCSIESSSYQLDSNIQDTDNEQLLSYLSSFGFNTSDYFIEDGNIIVEGDIGFNIENLQNEVAKQPKNSSRQFAHWQRVNMHAAGHVKIKTTSNVTAEWNNAINSAINDWNGIPDCRIRLRRVSFDERADITINRMWSNANYNALTSFPNYEIPGPTITINERYDHYSSSMKRHLMVHTIGHNLGLRHTNVPHPDSIHIPGTPITDYNSVMQYDVKSWSGFSSADINAAQYLYPRIYSSYIIVYEHPDYKGKSWFIQDGTNEPDAVRFHMNDRISSILVSDFGAKVTVYEHSNYRGDNMLILESYSNLPAMGFDDTISSIKWTAPTGKFAIIYQHEGYLGRAITITENCNDLSKLGFNDTMSSIELFNGARVVLYEDSNYRGWDTLGVTKSRAALNNAMNDEVSSIKFF